jgi:glutaredoxin
VVYVVYGITDCPSCLRACADIMERYPETQYVFVETDFSKKYREFLKKKFKWSTFPIITILKSDETEELVGGYADLQYTFIKETPP